jgi:hypothetical protein
MISVDWFLHKTCIVYTCLVHFTTWLLGSVLTLLRASEVFDHKTIFSPEELLVTDHKIFFSPELWGS